jgi:hypothetical protein
MTRTICGLVTALLVLTSCNPAPLESDESSGLPRQLSKQAQRGKVKKIDKGNQEQQPAGQGSASQAPGYTKYVTAEDPSDAGIAYADVITLRLQSDGTNLQVSVEMAGAIPDHTPGDSEVVGLGVDLYTSKGNYQLFASGENDGWFGYLDTPKGMKAYPGTFEIGGSTFVFTIPWSAVGGVTRGRFNAYVEWSSAEGFSEDYVPDETSKVNFEF